MLIVKVKICGITNYEDASAAIDMGTDLLGFNFYPKSPRYIEPVKAAKIISKLSAFTDIVGVFVNEPIEKIQETKNLCQLDWVQLHGDEDPEFCNEFRNFDVKVMKAIRVKDQKDVEIAENFFTDAILLDAFNPKKYGGTGVSFDWNVIGHIDKRIFLAGGINPDNAVKAVELGVYGIDVCSGVEIRPGKKDKRLMRKLFENIRHLRG
jgi:phosphoribosylanthranilate isomerase